VIEFGLTAFGVRDSPNPKQTFQVLLEKVVDRPTVIFLLWLLAGVEPDSATWKLDLASLLKKLIAEHGKLHEELLVKNSQDFGI